MSSTIQNVPPATSTVDTIKSGAVSTVEWVGRQIATVKNATISVITKTIEFVKPFFSSIAQHSRTFFESAKVWINANRGLSVGIAGALALAVVALSYSLLFKNTDNTITNLVEEAHQDATRNLPNEGVNGTE